MIELVGAWQFFAARQPLRGRHVERHVMMSIAEQKAIAVDKTVPRISECLSAYVLSTATATAISMINPNGTVILSNLLV